MLSGIDVHRNEVRGYVLPKAQVQLAHSVAAYLSGHMDQRITIAELARRFHVSDTCLKKAFRGVYGVPVFSYMRIQKMQSEAQLLIHTDRSVAAIAFILRKELKLLDVITMGRDPAINLGVDYDHVIRKLLFGVVLCMAVATAAIGPVSFLGLIVANLSRQVLKTYKHSHLILGASLMGMLALTVGQLISQHIFHFTVPVSTFVTIAGGVYAL